MDDRVLPEKKTGHQHIYMGSAQPGSRPGIHRCAHLIGQLVDAFGADHVLWGTDSIWYGTPQWQIEAFRRFEIPQELIDKHRYAPLTRAVKEQIFGLNAARVFAVDVAAKRNEIPKDYLSRMKMSYLEEGPRPSPAGTAGHGGSHEFGRDTVSRYRTARGGRGGPGRGGAGFDACSVQRRRRLPTSRVPYSPRAAWAGARTFRP